MKQRYPLAMEITAQAIGDHIGDTFFDHDTIGDVANLIEELHEDGYLSLEDVNTLNARLKDLQDHGQG